jgi:hypothetical protein
MNISRYVPMTAVYLIAVAGLTSCAGDGTGPGNGGDVTPPSVMATSPTSGELDVAVTTALTVTFSEPVDPVTITLASFTLQAGATGVGGTVTASGATATFTPSSALARGTLYTATVTTAVTDTAGNALPADHTWTFTTIPNQGATADAGPDQDVNRGEMVTLDGSGSSDPESDPLTYSWTQVFGSDVTGGSGTLTGVSPSFAAPAAVSTVQFDLVVDDGFVPSPPNRVQINVMEDKNNAVFVSPSGDDGNSGLRGAPLRTVQAAIGQAAGGGQGADVYVAAGTYMESLQLASGVSVYGGFSAEWARDPDTEVTTISGGNKAVSGIGVSSLSVDGLSITSGNATTSGESSYGVYLDDSQDVTIASNEITAGRGMSGTPGNNGAPGPTGQPGGPGQPGCENSATIGCSSCSRPLGGVPGSGPGWSGGVGGRPGQVTGVGSPGSQGSGPAGGAGGPGTPAGGGNWNTPSQYTGGFGGQGANGSDGGGGGAFGTVGVLGYTPADGQTGTPGQPGSGGGGGGGGGGGSSFCDSYGGGGGGGGAGGGPGGPGQAGSGGGGSFGVWLDGSTNIIIAENTITAGDGGPGGSGGPGALGGLGGEGGWGGDFARPNSGCPYGGSNDQDDGSNGARGGTGGRGGRGGHGGGGGGGPTIGIFETAASTSTITGNIFTIGSAGPGGSSAGTPGSTGARMDFRKGA